MKVYRLKFSDGMILSPVFKSKELAEEMARLYVCFGNGENPKVIEQDMETK
jgi:hypothetical protein